MGLLIDQSIEKGFDGKKAIFGLQRASKIGMAKCLTLVFHDAFPDSIKDKNYALLKPTRVCFGRRVPTR